MVVVPASVHETAGHIVTSVPVADLFGLANQVSDVSVVIVIGEEQDIAIEVGSLLDGLIGQFSKIFWNMKICICIVLINRQSYLTMSHISSK